MTSSDEIVVNRIVEYLPVNVLGEDLIVGNDGNLSYNKTGFTAFCTDLNNGVVELLIGDGVLFGKREGIDYVYRVIPDFIYMEKVETTNGTILQGAINSMFFHGKDNEFKYYLKDLKGKRLKRMYSPKDLKKI